MRRLAVALAILAVVPVTLRAQTEEQLRRAIRLYEGLEVERARDVFLQVISPASPLAVTEAQRVTAYKYLGATYATLGQQDSAITYFVAALQRDPLTDLDPRSFAETERSVFNAAKQRIFRVGLRPLPARDTLDPRTERINFGIATTHQGSVLLELSNTEVEQRFTLFEGEVDGLRDIPFNGIIPRVGLIPPGTYELVIVGRSNLDSTRGDSTSALVEILQDFEVLEDTLASFNEQRDLLPERAPSSSAVRDLLRGFGIGGAAIVSSKFIGRTTLGESGVLPASVALIGAGAGVYAYLHRRSHPELPENIAENARRREQRAATNAAIMQRNADRIARTKLLIRALTAAQ